MCEDNYDRRRFLGTAVITIAAAQIGVIGSAQDSSPDVRNSRRKFSVSSISASCRARTGCDSPLMANVWNGWLRMIKEKLCLPRNPKSPRSCAWRSCCSRLSCRNNCCSLLALASGAVVNTS